MDGLDLEETRFNCTHNEDLNAQVCVSVKRHTVEEAIEVKIT